MKCLVVPEEVHRIWADSCAPQPLEVLYNIHLVPNQITHRLGSTNNIITKIYSKGQGKLTFPGIKQNTPSTVYL